MRVISQCGKFDLPYECFAFVAERTAIYAVCVSGHGQRLMAQYEKPEKVEKAMEMLHNAFKYSLFSDLVFDCDAKVERPYVFAENQIFRFPADDEIEVDQ